jgi:hypothetical protein
MAAKKKTAKKTAKKVAKKTAKVAAKKTKAAKKTPAKASKPAKKAASSPSSGQSGPAVDLLRDRLNDKEIRVVTVLSGDLNPVPINALATNCFADQPVTQANSWVRNSLRRLVRGKWVDKVGKGTYRLSDVGRGRFLAPQTQVAAESAQA